MDANPVGFLVIAIVALAAGFVLVCNKLKPFHDAVKATVGSVIARCAVAVVDMIVGCAFAESEMILCCGFAEGSMISGAGVIVASEVAAVNMILRCMIVADVTVGGGDAVAVILLLISPTTRSALFPKIHLALPPFPSRGETCFYGLKHGAYARAGNV